ncbi:MAG: flagellar hook-basal body protein [Clostridiaceae bacterium]|nr:flagellar hook-basal body protein [Clostridiaceae bacterium]MBW4860036.1 flagellar hook-basal body protein [Clostridiaceae bacterium]MBW4867126.1 flagellar hook-basal body protein [Clostridiaceae bacterium]
MNRGLYISATSMIANQRRLEAISNNLSNINTTGFKKDVVLTESFPEVLLSKINDRPDFRPQRENEIEYETNGDVHRARTNEGYFMVRTPNGISYVKDIRFVVDDEGYLKTFYKNEQDEYKTDGENYILDGNHNPIQGGGNIEGLLEGIVSRPGPRVVGTMNAGAKVKKVVTDFTQGGLLNTEGKFDLALEGSGFFKVQGEDGEIYYTRDGSFTVNSMGQLTTSEGYLVMGTGGPITINGNDVEITKGGQVFVDGNMVANLDIVDLDNKEFLRKIGDNFYRMADDVEAEEMPFQGEVFQGFLENSNVDSIKEMVEMISLLRNFETCQKAIRVQDEMMEKSANEIGRV